MKEKRVCDCRPYVLLFHKYTSNFTETSIPSPTLLKAFPFPSHERSDSFKILSVSARKRKFRSLDNRKGKKKHQKFIQKLILFSFSPRKEFILAPKYAEARCDIVVVVWCSSSRRTNKKNFSRALGTVGNLRCVGCTIVFMGSLTCLANDSNNVFDFVVVTFPQHFSFSLLSRIFIFQYIVLRSLVRFVFFWHLKALVTSTRISFPCFVLLILPKEA